MKLFLHRKALTFISLFVFSCITFSLATAGLAPYNKVSPKTFLNQDNKNTTDTKMDSLHFEQILDSLPFVFDSNSFISDNEWKELEIDLVLEHWKKYRKTKFDLWGMKKLLRLAPQGSKEIIRYLVENNQAYETVDKILNEVKNGEDALIAYWDDSNAVHRNAQNLYYSRLGSKINRFLNSNTIALEISQALDAIQPIVSLLAFLGINGLVINFTNSRLFGTPFNWKKSFLGGLKKPLRNHNPRPNIFKNGYDIRKIYNYYEMGTLGDHYIVNKHILKGFFEKYIKNERVLNILTPTASIIAQGNALIWRDYFEYITVKTSIETIRFLYEVTTQLQQDMVKIAKVFQSLENIEYLDPQLDATVLKNIQNYFKKENISENLKKLSALLNSATFEKETFWFSRGRLLKAHKLLTQIKDELSPSLQSIALLGGYRAIAQMVREHQDTNVHYCFVEFVENNKPLIKMKNAWAPFMQEDNIVTNNVTLGTKNNPPHAVITGPNGGGKSTFMMTVAFNVLISRLGIAAADHAYMSHFERIRTSLHPQQEIRSGLSSFMAEHRRIQEVRETINMCDGNILVLLDEPYKGTVEMESASRVYAFGKEIAKNKNCTLLMATHLKKPIELTDDVPGLFANYQMGYTETKSTPSRFKRTFKVLDGPAMWWFDDADKRTRFINWLLDQDYYGNLDATSP